MDNYLQDLVNAAAILALTCVLVNRLRALRRTPHDRSLQVFVGLTASMTAVVVVGNPRVYAAIDHATGVPHLAQLLIQGLALVAACGVQIWVSYWTYSLEEASAKVPARVWILAGALILLVVFFILAPIDREYEDGHFVEAYATAAWVGPFYLVFLGYLGFTLADLCRMSWRYVSIADNSVLRFGLRLVAAGALFGVLYAANTGVYVVSGLAGFAPLWPHQLANRVTQAGTIFLLALGSTCSVWALKPARWWAGHQQYRRLYPLWCALNRAFPNISLDPQPAPWILVLRVSQLSVERLRYRVARLVTEINDGRLQLRPYLDPALASRAQAAAEQSGVSGDRIAAFVEAARIDGALRAVAAGDAPTEDRGAPTSSGGVDLDAEIQWFSEVSEAFVVHSGRRMSSAPGTSKSR